jgi:hypothetical protein
MTVHSVTKSWNWRAVTACFPVAVVAVIAGVVSYGHIEHLALLDHQSLDAARLYPFAVDFLIVAGSVLLLDGFSLGWLSVGAGVAATLYANVESGVSYGAGSATLAAWPAVAFTVASFTLERYIKRRLLNQPVAETVAEVVAEPEPVAVQPEAPAIQPEVPAVIKTIMQPDPPETEPAAVAELPDNGRMATDVVAEWDARGELHRLWEIVDDLSERALKVKFGLRTRNQGVRLKSLREKALSEEPALG